MEAIFGSSISSPSSAATAQTFIKFVVVSLFSFTFFFFFNPFSYPTTTTRNPSQNLSFFDSAETPTQAPSPLAAPPPPPAAVVVIDRTGIINEMGIMTENFTVGDFDEGLMQSMVVSVGFDFEKEKEDSAEGQLVKIEKFGVCDKSKMQHVPCFDNLETGFRSNRSLMFQRHCPENITGLDCRIPRPEGYQFHVPWPKSRDEVWFHNVPLTTPLEDKGGQSWISRRDDKFIFPCFGTPCSHGVDQYVDRISKMVPEIAFGQHTRVVLDVGSGVANLGAYLMDLNVTTLSIDVHENKIQFALERGVPAMISSFGTRRLPFPSQAFDLIHCSDCGVIRSEDDGTWLLEANRILRAGGYFVFAVQTEEKFAEQWEERNNLTSSICWELKGQETNIAIWQKPRNNSCYLSRDPDAKPSLCGINDNPDDIWGLDVEACITRLPENGYGSNITNWPARLHSPPDRLFSIQMDSYNSRRELYKAHSSYWYDIVHSYVTAFRLNQMNIRNAMDMKAGYGGIAAALSDLGVDCWVMNVVPVSGSNTLPVIYDRGLVGVLHDWCEPFDTYPRTYDFLNAAGLFSVERERCNISNIMLEMDRILRPGGRVYIRDTKDIIDQLQQMANAVGWVCLKFDTGEGPGSNWKLVTCEKRM